MGLSQSLTLLRRFISAICQKIVREGGQDIRTGNKFRGFSRSTTSLPRRKISTSSLAKRNSFGKRTAWLFPDLNTLAVVTFASVYTRRRYGRRRSQPAIRRLQLNGLRGPLTCWHTSDHSCAPGHHGLRQSEPLHHPSRDRRHLRRRRLDALDRDRGRHGHARARRQRLRRRGARPPSRCRSSSRISTGRAATCRSSSTTCGAARPR